MTRFTGFNRLLLGGIVAGAAVLSVPQVCRWPLPLNHYRRRREPPTTAD